MFVCACSPIENYTDPTGPRFAGDYIENLPTPRNQFLAVTYNLKFGEDVDAAIRNFSSETLSEADVILMQEMDAESVDSIAQARKLAYVYYPASRNKNGRDFGNAVLSAWHFGDDAKIILPHFDPYNHRMRIAVSAALQTPHGDVTAVSVHSGIPTLGLAARLDQVSYLLDEVGHQELLIVGGDLNTSDPGSTGQTAATFRLYGLDWASSEAGTTATSAAVDMTLDYIFARGIKPVATGVLRRPGSDHFPLWVSFSWPP